MAQNLAAQAIPAPVLASVKTHLQAIQAELAPYVIALSVDDRKSLLKMGDKSAPFVKKVSEYVVTNPEFVPGYLSVDELKVDFGNVEALFPITNQLQQVCDNAADTAMVCGSEAYTAALMYYNSVQRAAEEGIPGARAIADDLKQRFPSPKRKAAAPDAPPLQPQQQS